MGVKLLIFGVLALGGAYLFHSALQPDLSPVEFPKDGYFGQGNKKPDDTSIKPFKINVPNEILEDLKNRIKRARIGHLQLEDVPDFSYGFNLKTLNNFKDYWLEKYDWRKWEAQLNKFNQFTTQIEGLKIHFIHAKPPEKKYSKVIPLLIVHGWPGNVFEFYKIIPILTDPNSFLKEKSDFAFEVVAPSIPGYGWSEASHKAGLDQISTARIFNKLMTERLKFKKYLVQGGDWGSLVVSNIGRMFPENIYGVHLNMAFIPRNLKTTLLQIFGSYFPTLVWKDREFDSYSVKKMFIEIIKETGYMHIQSTKPDTIGVGLNDSPIGLMTYILEKFSTWTNPSFRDLPDGGLEKKFTKDELLTIIMIYWVNGNILPSQRYYKEFFSHLERFDFANSFIRAPVGVASFPHDLGIRTPREICETVYNVTHYTLMKDGGHFAAFEMPKELAEDVFTFMKKFN